MDLRDYIKEERKVFKQLNPTIDKAFSDNAGGRKEGRRGLEKLRGKDEVVPFVIGNAHQVEYDYTGNPEDAQRAVEECKHIANGGYTSVARNIQDLKARLEN